MGVITRNSTHPKSAILAAILSLIIPGAGQVYEKKVYRGIALFFTVMSALAVVVWYGHAAWFIPVITLWLWVVWDAYSGLNGGAPIWICAILWLVMAYGIGWQVTEINFGSLFSNPERASSILSPMLNPDFLEEPSEKNTGWVEIEVPCSAQPPKQGTSTGSIKVSTDVACGLIGSPVKITITGMWPDMDGVVYWQIPQSTYAKRYNIKADSNGNAELAITVPPESLTASPDPTISQIHRLYVVQTKLLGGIEISKNGTYVIQGIFETLALAFLATTIGALLALPFGFLGAHNLMKGNVVTLAIYYIVRTIMNVVRSIESLIMAIIFVVIVGLGPFPGMLAITVHTIAALGKLYSEVIEGIDTGPIEAIRATGANWLQVIRYAVIPQIVPALTSLTIYRWDINVRSSTIIGFVGGGGIGFFLYQWILLADYRAVSTSFIAIAIVVVILDFFSARLRERLV